MRTVLDTHAWIWWVTEDRRLSRRGAKAIHEALDAGELLLSMISIWEVAKKVEKRQLLFDRPMRDWLDQATGRAGLMLAELTPAILIDSCDLPQPFHGDPADQIIVATARHERAALVTKDGNLRRYPHVQTVW
jgi:PIN domain nuclease of toxin-antitoxin system